MSTITRSQISKELVPGLNAILGQSYKDVGNYYEKIFTIESSDRAFEEEVMKSGFGLASTKREGAAVQYDEQRELWTARYQHETVELGFIITQEAMEDNLYENDARRSSQALGRSMSQTKNTKGADILNNGFDTNFPIGDGQPLFSTAHPTQSVGDQSNATTADLSETALEAAITAIQLFKDDRGLLIGATPVSLHGAPAQQFVANKILNSELSTNLATVSGGVSNRNDVNVIRTNGLIPQGFHSNPFLTDTDAWYIKTDCPDGLKMFQRASLTMKEDEDFDTDNVLIKARERYSFGASDWRGVYGSDGSAG